VAVAGAITNTTIRTGGDIQSVSASAINAARIYAGANVPDEEFPPFLPTDPAQFTTPARIGSVTASTTDGLSVAAASIGDLFLGAVATDSPIPFGVAALTVDALAGRTAETEEGPGVPFAFNDLDAQPAFDQQAATTPLGTSSSGCSDGARVETRRVTRKTSGRAETLELPVSRAFAERRFGTARTG
jgi:hypothetical protein